MKIRKVFMIYNSGAGKNRSQVRAKEIEALLSARGVDCVLFESNNKAADAQFALMVKDAQELGEDGLCVVVLGGDGTLGAIVRSMVNSGVDVPVAVFPCGTANDFATANKIPKKANKFVDFLFSAAPQCTDIAVVSGVDNVQKQATSTIAINAVGAGNFSNGVTVYNTKAKKAFGILGYYFGCVREFFHMKSCELTFNCDGEKIKADTLMFYLVNSPRAGGFAHFAPDAKINDGKFELVIVKKTGFWGCLSVFNAIRHGKVDKNKHIITRSVKNVTVSGGEHHPKFFRCDIDGNAGPEGTLKVSIKKNKIRIFNNLKDESNKK